MKCNDLTYEVGKTYEIDNFQICSHGFHFCVVMKDVLDYYAWDENFVLLEVEALGKHDTQNDKTVTDKLKILRIVPKEEYDFTIPYTEYDANGNVTHRKSGDGENSFKWWKEYDANGNATYCRDSDGYESWNEYDANGNHIHHRDNNGYHWRVEFNSDNKPTYRNFDNKRESRFEYDANGNMVHYYDTNSNYAYWAEYDANGNMIRRKDSRGNVSVFEYDANGNIIYYKTDYEESWREFDSNGNMIYYKLCDENFLKEWRITIH